MPGRQMRVVLYGVCVTHLRFDSVRSSCVTRSDAYLYGTALDSLAGSVLAKSVRKALRKCRMRRRHRPRSVVRRLYTVVSLRWLPVYIGHASRQRLRDPYTILMVVLSVDRSAVRVSILWRGMLLHGVAGAYWLTARND